LSEKDSAWTSDRVSNVRDAAVRLPADAAAGPPDPFEGDGPPFDDTGVPFASETTRRDDPPSRVPAVKSNGNR
jgi:hypothetical protein